MILPGLISLAFYKRIPSTTQVVGGLVATIVLSGMLGYVSPGGPLGRLGSVIVAIVGGVILYVGIWAYLRFRYIPKHTQPPTPAPPSASP